MADRELPVWAHNALAAHLEKIRRQFPGFPDQTLIIRNRQDPECHILLTNESDEVGEALRAVICPPKPSRLAQPDDTDTLL